MWWDDPPEVAGQVASDGVYRSGLMRLAIACGVLVVATLATYALPGLADFRPWEPGEPLPLASIVSFKPTVGAGAEAAGGGDTGLPMTEEQAREATAAVLGEELAANLGPEALAASDDDEVPEVVETHAGARIEAEELKGLVREIEDPSGRAMDAFYEALRETASSGSKRITRIAHWGDSTIAADDVTSTLRRRLQKRFGDAGHGFLLIGKGNMPYRHRDVINVESGNWNVHSLIHGERDDGRYGFGGVLHRSRGDGRARFGTVDKGGIGRAVSRFELYYQVHPKGAPVILTVDQDEPRTVETRADEPQDAWASVDVPDGPHTLSLRVGSGGEARLYGMVMERPGPGVVYDSLGIVGARAARLLNLDETHIAGQVAHRASDLLVIAFGGNEADDRGMNFERYEASLARVVRRLRAGRPEASCLLVAPLDQGERDRRGRIRTMPNIPKIVEAQRRVAQAEGCGFFDTFMAMGGPGSMGRWYKSKPRLGWGDFRHATPGGYEVIGNLIYKALLSGFSDYLSRLAPAEGPSPQPPPAVRSPDA